MAESPYFAPIAAFGKTDEKTLSSAASAASQTISIDNSGGEYEVGDHVFIAENTGLENEYLGTCLSVTATTITVKVPLTTAKDDTATVWQPTTYYAFTQGSGTRIVDRTITGTRFRPTRGGRIYVTKIADQYGQFIVSFPFDRPGKNVDFDGMRTFVLTDRDSGLKSFSFSFYNRMRAAPHVIKCKMQLDAVSEEDDIAQIGFIGSPSNRSNVLEGVFELRLYAEDMDFYVES